MQYTKEELEDCKKHIPGYLRRDGLYIPERSFSDFCYRKIIRFFDGETLAERSERMLMEWECERRIRLNRAQILSKKIDKLNFIQRN